MCNVECNNCVQGSVASIAPKGVDYLKEVRILSIEYSVHTCSLPRSQLRSVKIEDKIVNKFKR